MKTLRNLTVIVFFPMQNEQIFSVLQSEQYFGNFKTLLGHLLTTLIKLDVKNIFLVADKLSSVSEEYLTGNYKNVEVINNNNISKNKNILKIWKNIFDRFGKYCLVIPGSMPLITKETIELSLQAIEKTYNTAMIIYPFYKNSNNHIKNIKNQKFEVIDMIDKLDPRIGGIERDVINISTYIYDSNTFIKYIENSIDRLFLNEVLFKNFIKKLICNKNKVCSILIPNNFEFTRLNSIFQLDSFERIIKKMTFKKLIADGVVIKDINNTFISEDVKISKGTVIEPYCFISGKSEIFENCIIGPFTQIVESVIQENTRINTSVILESKIGKNNNIGPYAYIRPETSTGDFVKIGTFCETRKSNIKNNTKIPHLSYIGNCQIGSDVTVGGGTLTCNFNGFNKNNTIIGDNAFIGANTMFIAPVKVGDGAIVAAGSVITKNVPKDYLAVERNIQKNIKEGAINYRKKKIIPDV